MDTYVAQRIFEVAPNFALVEWLQLTYLLVFSQSVLDSLPPEYQQAVWQAAEHAINFTNEFAVDYVQNIGIGRLEEVGAIITRPDPKPFFDALAPLIESNRGKIGDEILGWLEANN